MDLYKAFTEIFLEHYRQTHAGRMYIPDMRTHTTAMHHIIDAITFSMNGDGFVVDESTAGSYFFAWLSRAWANSDQFSRDHWSVEYISNHFNYFNEKAHQHGNQARSQHRDGISDEYVLQAILEATGKSE